MGYIFKQGRIKEIRLAANMTQVAFARQLTTSQQEISRLESGAAPTVPVLLHIANTFEVDPASFFTSKDAI